MVAGADSATGSGCKYEICASFYENGVLKRLRPVELPENQRVALSCAVKMMCKNRRRDQEPLLCQVGPKSLTANLSLEECGPSVLSRSRCGKAC